MCFAAFCCAYIHAGMGLPSRLSVWSPLVGASRWEGVTYKWSATVGLNNADWSKNRWETCFATPPWRCCSCACPSLWPNPHPRSPGRRKKQNWNQVRHPGLLMDLYSPKNLSVFFCYINHYNIIQNTTIILYRRKKEPPWSIIPVLGLVKVLNLLRGKVYGLITEVSVLDTFTTKNMFDIVLFNFLLPLLIIWYLDIFFATGNRIKF